RRLTSWPGGWRPGWATPTARPPGTGSRPGRPPDRQAAAAPGGRSRDLYNDAARRGGHGHLAPSRSVREASRVGTPEDDTSACREPHSDVAARYAAWSRGRDSGTVHLGAPLVSGQALDPVVSFRHWQRLDWA